MILGVDGAEDFPDAAPIQVPRGLQDRLGEKIVSHCQIFSAGLPAELNQPQRLPASSQPPPLRLLLASWRTARARMTSVPFNVSQKTLDRLEWPEVVERLRRLARTPRGRARCEADDSLFEEDLGEARTRLAETSEARAILDAGALPPLEGVRDQTRVLGRLRKRGMLTGEELLGLRSTLGAIHETSRFLLGRAEEAPRLAGWAHQMLDHSGLESEIDAALEADGEVRDSASRDLAAARRESRQIAGDVQRRIASFLQDPEIVEALSDSFFTIRNDRYVLPVRADARGRVSGIVHDASSTGTTLFVEPQAVVDLNNRLKQAELTIERETRRVLRALTERAAQARPAIESNLEILENIDLAFARGELSKEMERGRTQARGRRRVSAASAPPSSPARGGGGSQRPAPG